MTLIQFLFLISFLPFFHGCSFFTNKLQDITQSNSLNDKNYNLKNNFCPSNSHLEYFVEDEKTRHFYKNLNPLLFEQEKISFIEKAIMFSLIEMSRRPDTASPQARLQVYIKFEGENFYFDFKGDKQTKKLQMPYLDGLNTITKHFLKNKNLISIASDLDKFIPKNLPVSSDFGFFLQAQKKRLAENSFYRHSFLKGDENITMYETFERIYYKDLIKSFNTTYSFAHQVKNIDDDLTKLFPNQNKNIINCNYSLDNNFHFDKIENSHYEIQQSHAIGLKENSNLFLSISSSSLDEPLTSIPGMGYFMKSTPWKSPAPVCKIKTPDKEILLISASGKNSWQHLEHLISYEIEKIDSLPSLNQLLSFSRHLFLSNPDRILYESKRGRKNQLDFFLTTNFPIYHIKTLGNIFGYASFKNQDTPNLHLYVDDRTSSSLWCKE